jgi:acyl carrier protein
VAYLQDHFSISVADEEVGPDNLDSVDRIVAYVGRKLAAAA